MDIVKIAIAEDNHRHAHLLTEYIEQINNCKVVWKVHNGLHLLTDLEQLTTLPDILFLDLDMPRVKGILCLSIIRHLYPSIKVIISTSFIQQDLVEIALSEGALGFLPKYLLVTDTGNKQLYQQSLQQTISSALANNCYVNTALFSFKKMDALLPSTKTFMQNLFDHLSWQQQTYIYYNATLLDYATIASLMHISEDEVTVIQKKLRTDLGLDGNPWGRNRHNILRFCRAKNLIKPDIFMAGIKLDNFMPPTFH